MTTRIDATLIDGVLKPDRQLPLPDQTRVRLTIEPIEDRSAAAMAAWLSIQTRLAQRLIRGTGVRYTRDELHERR